MKSKHLPGIALALAMLAPFALAQDGSVTVTVNEGDEYGDYLTDSQGMTLYLFVNEQTAGEGSQRMTEGVRAAATACSGGCLDAWPPLTAGQVEAGEKVDAELLYTEQVGDRMQVVYNGWPLYYFSRDSEPGQTNGQGAGRAPNVWYLVGTDGRRIEEGSE